MPDCCYLVLNIADFHYYTRIDIDFGNDDLSRIYTQSVIFQIILKLHRK